MSGIDDTDERLRAALEAFENAYVHPDKYRADGSARQRRYGGSPEMPVPALADDRQRLSATLHMLVQLSKFKLTLLEHAKVIAQRLKDTKAVAELNELAGIEGPTDGE